MKALIIGMGIGALYYKVLNEMGWETITVDLLKLADYNDLDAALADHNQFDAAFICTPNFTHEPVAYKIAKHCRVVFVEKPGVISAEHWQALVSTFPLTKFLMVKNNQYREELVFFKNLSDRSSTVHINWINNNRIPNPGSWFTDSSRSFGGVSRDLMPHLLSLVCALKPNTYSELMINRHQKRQMWTLDSLSDTDYGSVDADGIYDVDDYHSLELVSKDTIFELTAIWRNLTPDDVSINFDMADRTRKFNLGLCPESAYINMIKTTMQNLSNKDWWHEQLLQDLWIHQLVNQ